MKPTDYLIAFKSGNKIRVAREIGDALVFDKVFNVGGKNYFFAQSDFLYLVPVMGEEGVIEPRSPKQVKSDKDKRENKVIDQMYGVQTTEQKAMS